MDSNYSIKSFLKPEKKKQYPQCFMCGKAVRFPATCDNCGNMVCHRHRPAFMKPWYCSKCLERWQQWAQSNNSNEAVEQIVMAESLYDNERTAEADKILDDVFVDLWNYDKLDKGQSP